MDYDGYFPILLYYQILDYLYNLLSEPRPLRLYVKPLRWLYVGPLRLYVETLRLYVV